MSDGGSSVQAAPAEPPAEDARPVVRDDVVAAAMVAVGVLAALAVLALLRAAPTQLTAIAVAVVLALALDPVLRAVQRRARCGRGVATLLVGVVLAAVFGAVIGLLGPKAATQAGEFADELPATVEELYGWPVVGDRLRDADAVGRVEGFVDDLPSRVDADSIADAADRVVANAVTVLVAFVVTVAIMLDGEAIVARGRRVVPARHRDRADEVGRIVYRSMARYFAGSVSVAVLNGLVILTAGLVLGVPLAPLAGVWAALTNLIPQVGGFLGGSFFVLLAVTQGPVTGLIAVVVFFAYQQLENNVIAPVVIGEAVDLTPPTTMLAALVGGAAAGVPGALVATPLVGAAKTVWRSVHGDVDPDGEGSGGDGGPGLLRGLVERLRPGGS